MPYERAHHKLKEKWRIKIETNQLARHRRFPSSLVANAAAAKAKAGQADAGGLADGAKFAVFVQINP